MNNKIVIRNREPQEIKISGGGEVIGITNVYVNGIDVTEGSAAYVIVPTKLSELENNTHFISEEVDPTVPYYVKQITQADINKWNNKQDTLVSGTNIKTINGNSIMGSGNLTIDTSYTAGTGIEITEENVINNTITSYDDLTDLPTIPSKTSDLLNDSGYVISEDLAEVAFTGSYVSLSNTPEIPDSTSQLLNDSGFITNTVNDLTNYLSTEFLYNMFPKSSDSGANINLSDTVVYKLKMSLAPSTLSQDATPTPSSPQDIHTISGDNTINIGSKNILNYSKDPITGTGLTRTINSDGSVTVTGVPNYNNASVFQYDMTGDLINGEDYVIWQTAANNNLYLQINIIDNGGGATQYKYLSGNASATFTADTVNKTYQMRLQTGTTANWGADSRTITSFYQLEVGTTPSSFEKNDITSYSIDLGDIEYCKIGTYEDRIFKNIPSDIDYDSEKVENGWYIKKNIGKVVLDGTNVAISSKSGTTYNNMFLTSPITNILKPSSNAYLGNIISNLLEAKTVDNIFANDTYGIGIRTSGEIVIGVTLSSPDNTVPLINTWLESNNITCYYALSTPTYTQITGTLAEQLEAVYYEAMSKEGQTNISQINDDLPFVISAETLKSMANL